MRNLRLTQAPGQLVKPQSFQSIYYSVEHTILCFKNLFPKQPDDTREQLMGVMRAGKQTEGFDAYNSLSTPVQCPSIKPGMSCSHVATLVTAPYSGRWKGLSLCLVFNLTKHDIPKGMKHFPFWPLRELSTFKFNSIQISKTNWRFSMTTNNQ